MQRCESARRWFAHSNIESYAFCFRWNNLSLKCQRFTPSGCKEIGIRNLEFIAKTQFLYENDLNK